MFGLWHGLVWAYLLLLLSVGVDVVFVEDAFFVGSGGNWELFVFIGSLLEVFHGFL